MADNVTYQAATIATPSPGEVIASDQVQVNGTQPIGQVQYVKLVDGTPNGTGAIPGDSVNGLDVDVTRSAVPVASTATRSSVGGAIVDTALLAANAARKMAIIVNESDADLYVALGAAASLSDYTYFLPRQSGGQKSQLELPTPVYTGAIRGIWSSGVGNARITELT